MKKFYFEITRKLLEKPTEPKNLFKAPGRCWVIAEDEAEARKLAFCKLRCKHYGTGILIYPDSLTLTATAELPTDWNYGYGEARGTGTAEDKAALWADNK